MVGGTSPARKVMVVADPNRESAAALQYALSHVAVENDTLILLHVELPNSSAWKIPFSAIFKRPLLTNASTGASSPVNSSSSVDAFGCAGGVVGGSAGGAIDFLEAMKHACGMANPKLKIQAAKVGLDGKDKAAVILAQCTAHKVELLIVGQKTTLSNALLG